MGRAAALILGLAATGLLAAFLWWAVWKAAYAARRAYLRWQMSPAEREILDNRARRVRDFLAAERERERVCCMKFPCEEPPCPGSCPHEEHLRDNYRV